MNKTVLIGLFLVSDTIAAGLLGYALLQQKREVDLMSNPIFIAALGIFVGVPVLLVAFYSLNARKSDEEILRTGTPATATIVEVMEVKSSPVKPAVSLKLQVNPANGEYYEVKVTVPTPLHRPSLYRSACWCMFVLIPNIRNGL